MIFKPRSRSAFSIKRTRGGLGWSRTGRSSAKRSATGNPSGSSSSRETPAFLITNADASFGTKNRSLQARYQMELIVMESVTTVEKEKGRSVGFG